MEETCTTCLFNAFDIYTWYIYIYLIEICLYLDLVPILDQYFDPSTLFEFPLVKEFKMLWPRYIDHPPSNFYCNWRGVQNILNIVSNRKLIALYFFVQTFLINRIGKYLYNVANLIFLTLRLVWNLYDGVKVYHKKVKL